MPTAIVIAATSATLRDVTTVTLLLCTVLLVAVVTKYIRVPYTVALVVVGLILGVSGAALDVPLTEDVILEVFLPALLFEAAYNLPWARLKAEIRYINALAIPGVLASTAVVGGIVHLAGLRWAPALLFGALISATDPVSVIATFRQLGTDRRLSIIVEGESLFNDGTALVVFRLVLGVSIAGSVSAVGTAVAFAASIVGGIAFGLAVGYLAALLLRQIDDYLVEIATTLLLAYGTFILAERLNLHAAGVAIGASPVIAVVVFGLVMGNYASRASMSAATRISMHSTWEFLAYLANSFIFLLIGLQIHSHTFSFGDLPLVGWAIVGVLVSRALVVYGVTLLMNARLSPPRRVPLAFQHIINWGGLRGAVAIAAALSIPAAIPERGTLLLLTFAIVLFTLLVQGLTIRPLVGWVGLGRRQAAHLVAFERLQGQLVAVQAARRALTTMRDSGEITPDIYTPLTEAYQQRADTLAAALEGLQVSAEDLRAERMIVAQRKALQAEKDALLSLRARGIITGSVFQVLVGDADLRLLRLESHTEADDTTGVIAVPLYDERATNDSYEPVTELPQSPTDAPRGAIPPTILETPDAPLVPPGPR